MLGTRPRAGVPAGLCPLWQELSDCAIPHEAANGDGEGALFVLRSTPCRPMLSATRKRVSGPDNPDEQPAQDVGAGDHAPFLVPNQNRVVVDHVVAGMFRLDL